MKDIFTRIIDTHYWQEVVCGSGSTIASTHTIRSALIPFLRKHNITSVLDAPCGDFSWMSLIDWPNDITYMGADIVENLILANRQKYPKKIFYTMDISTDPFPNVDLLFCRDCLFHFSQEDLFKTFRNIAKSKIKYVMLTNYPNGDNRDIQTGAFRELMLEQDPINLPKPLDLIMEHSLNRNISLWPVKVLGKFL
jgi:hypothetical protein